MADGTVYVGISPTDGRPLYTMPHDLPELYSWDAAKTAASAQTFTGHKDWRVPEQAELNMLYLNREAIGGFRRDWYWSSTEYYTFHAWYQTFGSGSRRYYYKNSNARVRCVRSG